MKTPLTLAFLLLAPTATCWAQTATRQACNVVIDVTDPDPKGTHVRTAPGGAVIATLKNATNDGWIAVHVTGQLGDWYEIDRANLIDADLPPGGKVIFQGAGYLHKSVVGVSGMQAGAFIYREHNIKSSPLGGAATGDEQVELLGCFDDFLKVHVKQGTGWTQHACTNMNTTCV